MYRDGRSVLAMTETEYAEFVNTVRDMVYLADLEQLMANHPHRVAA